MLATSFSQIQSHLPTDSVRIIADLVRGGRNLVPDFCLGKGSHSLARLSLDHLMKPVINESIFDMHC